MADVEDVAEDVAEDVVEDLVEDWWTRSVYRRSSIPRMR